MFTFWGADYYAVNRLKKEVQHEAGNIYNNKKLFSVIGEKKPLLI